MKISNVPFISRRIKVRISAINPIGRQRLIFRRSTTRYGFGKGTFSSNQGYLSVARDANSGQFVSRELL
tara:strand:+ start:629 stop:835 length:207 start_codon:yes stop_codon:yes gene_type:complete